MTNKLFNQMIKLFKKLENRLEKDLKAKKDWDELHPRGSEPRYYKIGAIQTVRRLLKRHYETNNNT